MILKQDIYKAWIYIICLYLEKQSINLNICLYQIVSIYLLQAIGFFKGLIKCHRTWSNFNKSTYV